MTNKMNTVSVKNCWFLVAIYLFIALLFFLTIGLDVLEGKLVFQFYSDSKVWEAEAMHPQFKEATTVSRNTFGPVTILNLIGPQNYWGIFGFNIIVFLISLYLISDKKEVFVYRLFFLILLSPITFTSLLSSNKEIFSLASTALLIYNHKHKKLYIIPIILFVSYLSRWQYTVFYIVYLFAFSRFNFLREKRLGFVIFFLLAITIMLFSLRNTMLYDVFSVYDRVVEVNYEGETVRKP